MPIELACPKCHKRLKAPAGSEGKKVKCPQCQEIVVVPGAAGTSNSAAASGGVSSSASASSAIREGGSTSSAPAIVPAPANAPGPAVERWYVKTRAGADYGPITRAEMDQWVSEQRFDTESQILREGANQWQWASDLYPQLDPSPSSARTAVPEKTATPEKPAPEKPAAEKPAHEKPVAPLGTSSDPFSATGAVDFESASQPAIPASFLQPAIQPASWASPEASFTLPTSGAIADVRSAPATSFPRDAASSGYSPGAYAPLELPSDKSRMTAGLLGILAGMFGVHRFYLGYAGIGVAQLVVTLATCGIGAWWGIFEGIMILAGRIDCDAEGRKLRG